MYTDGALISLATGYLVWSPLVLSSGAGMLSLSHCPRVSAAQLWPATIGRKSGVPGAGRTATLDHWLLDTG